MNLARKTILIAMLALAGAASAQETTTAAETRQAPPAATTTATAAPETATTTGVAETATTTAAPSSVEQGEAAARVRNDFRSVLARHPSEVARILGLDPTLLANEPFLGRYPDIADYVARHPEIRRNPHYYLRDFEYYPPRREEPFEEFLEGLTIIAVIGLIVFALGWFIRTVIEQKRWNQLSRRQGEVHTKILDRFASSDEVLQYIKSPAGAKFLESAPIPLHAEKPVQNAPYSRMLWSIQIGVVVTVIALGLLLLSVRFDGEAGEGFFGMGIIAFSVGVGFIASAAVSLLLSRRLAARQEAAGPIDTKSLEEPGLMR